MSKKSKKSPPTAGQGQVEEERRKAEAALKLLDQETADGIIGEPGEEYQTLIQGVQGVHALLFAMYQLHGLRKNPASLRAGAQGMAMMLTIVHYAYALGIQQGMAKGAPETGA